MSFNIFDTILDKLFSPSKGIDIPLSRKFTGSQGLMHHSYSFQNIPPDYKQAFNGNEYVKTAHQLMTGFSLDSKMDFFHILESSKDTFVNCASKIFYPPNSTLQKGFHFRSYSDVFPGMQKTKIISQALNLFCEELSKPCKDSNSKPQMEDKPLQVNSDIESSPKKMKQFENDPVTVLPLVKACTVPEDYKQMEVLLNKELKSRKTKKLQKRSRKRRRRQKKNVIRTNIPKAECKVNVEPSLTSPSNSYRNRDIFCDIMSISEESNSVQILLPNFSSFVISVESDDSEWENSSDCDWLTDCSEFEFSGLFVTNLTARKTFPPEKECVFQMDTLFDSDEEQEIQHRKISLQMVNKHWAEATKGLERKLPLPRKVSFAPDDQLVQVVLVDFCERKGEWETYASERLRFKRRIEELEKVLSPCFVKEHREKVFRRLQQQIL